MWHMMMAVGEFLLFPGLLFLVPVLIWLFVRDDGSFCDDPMCGCSRLHQVHQAGGKTDLMQDKHGGYWRHFGGELLRDANWDDVKALELDIYGEMQLHDADPYGPPSWWPSMRDKLMRDAAYMKCQRARDDARQEWKDGVAVACRRCGRRYANVTSHDGAVEVLMKCPCRQPEPLPCQHTYFKDDGLSCLDCDYVRPLPCPCRGSVRLTPGESCRHARA